MREKYKHYIDICKSTIQALIYAFFAQIAFLFVNFDQLNSTKSAIVLISILTTSLAILIF